MRNDRRPNKVTGMSIPRATTTCGLIADDDPLIRMLVRVALARDGITVKEASTGAEAIAAGNSIDFAIIDAHMPGPSLAETIAGLRLSGSVPILVISGAFPEEALPADIDYLLKPFSLDRLKGEVDRMISSLGDHH